MMPRLPRVLLARASVIGVLLGVAYALSPLAVLFAAAMAALFHYAARGSTPRERRWILGALAIALAVRVALAATLVLLEDPHESWFRGLFGDGLYNRQRAAWLRHIAVGIPVHPQDFQRAFGAYGWTGYHYVLSDLQIIFGPSSLGLNLLNIAAFLTGVVLLYRVARAHYGRLPALGILMALALWPSWVIWSATTLKESIYFFLVAVTLAATVAFVEVPGWGRRLLRLAMIVAAAAALPTIRVAGYLPVVAVVTAGGIVWLGRSRPGKVLLVAVSVGGLALGWTQRERIEDQVVRAVRIAASNHIGHVTTKGYSYRLLDDQFYADFDRVDRMSFGEGFRFVGRALAAFVLQPIPWRAPSPTILMFLPQQMLWYVVVALVPFGVIYALRRNALLTLVLAALIGVEGAAVALPSGNIGTLVRHRDMVVPFILCLASPGAMAALGWVCARRSSVDSRQPSVPGLSTGDLRLSAGD